MRIAQAERDANIRGLLNPAPMRLACVGSLCRSRQAGRQAAKACNVLGLDAVQRGAAEGTSRRWSLTYIQYRVSPRPGPVKALRQGPKSRCEGRHLDAILRGVSGQLNRAMPRRRVKTGNLVTRGPSNLHKQPRKNYEKEISVAGASGQETSSSHEACMCRVSLIKVRAPA